jgi:hypothetical protein
MQEICQSGSEGGAKLTFVPTPISAQAAFAVLALVLLSDWVAEHADLLNLDFDHITRL